MNEINLMTVAEFFLKVMPLLLDHTLEKAERECVEGKVSAYWVVNVLRIDIKQK